MNEGFGGFLYTSAKYIIGKQDSCGKNSNKLRVAI